MEFALHFLIAEKSEICSVLKNTNVIKNLHDEADQTTKCTRAKGTRQKFLHTNLPERAS